MMPKDPEMLYISRTSDDRGWRVRLKRKKDYVHQSYNDFQWGSRDLALKAAKKFRDALIYVIS